MSGLERIERFMRIERRLDILEAKMVEVEKFLVHHKHSEEFEVLKKAFPKLFKGEKK